MTNPGDGDASKGMLHLRPQEFVAELAAKCEAMLPQLAHLAEAGDLADEKTLDQTLVVHAEMEESLAKYHRLLLEVSPAPLPSRVLWSRLQLVSITAWMSLAYMRKVA